MTTRWMILTLAALPGAAAAQQVPARLTLDDALAIARERNPDYVQAANSARAQGAQVRAGWGGFLPTLSAQLQFQGATSTTVTGQDDFGRPVELPTPVDFQRSSASQSINAAVTLFDGLGNLNSLRAARATADATDAARAVTLNQVEAEVTRRFYEALRTERLIVLEERLLTSAREQLSNTQRLFRAAAATQEDVLGAEADVANQEMQLERARGDARKARLSVRQQLGITEPVAFTVEGDLPAVEDPRALDADSLVNAALALHPRITQLDASAHAAHMRASAARGSRWPRITLSAGYSRSVSLSSYEALFEFNPQNRGFGFGMTLDLPLFTGFETSARVAQASLEARNADEALRGGQLAVEREVRAAFIDVQNAHRALELAERSAELSRERLRLSRERYAIGAIDFSTLQLLIDRAAQEERQLLNARFQYAQAVVTLDEQVGG